MNTPPISYKRHRFPPQIIAHAVWLYFRFPLSLRLVEEMLLECGIVVSYETIRRWGKKFGPDYARRLHRKKPSRNDVWHLDEVVITIAGRKHWLWRAVDQDGYVLDEIVQARRNTKAAKRLLTRLLKKQGIAPKRMITDKLRSYGAARRQVMPTVEQGMTGSGATNSRLVGIDIVRIVAALGVMAFHIGYFSWANPGSTPGSVLKQATSYPELTAWTFWGRIGPQIFFLVSGFVIAYSAANASGLYFLRSRFLRLVPAVLICATITLAIAWWIEWRPVDDLALRYWHSITFDLYGPWVDGAYWTLNGLEGLLQSGGILPPPLSELCRSGGKGGNSRGRVVLASQQSLARSRLKMT